VRVCVCVCGVCGGHSGQVYVKGGTGQGWGPGEPKGVRVGCGSVCVCV